MSVRETLELDISEALTAIEQVGDRLASVAQAFGEVLSDSLQQALDGLPVITPEVDVESVSDEVEQALADATAEEQTVTVDADAGSVTAEIDSAIANVDTTVEVTVDADTSAASQAVEQLGDALGGADEAGAGAEQSLTGVAATAAAVGRGAGAASGGLGRVTGALGALGPAGLAAGVGIGAAATAGGFLYDAAFESVAVTQAWENSLGDLGARIEDLSSGTTGFSTNLRQLAQDTGSSDEAVLIATQRYTEFQRAAGLTNDQIVENSQGIAVLAAQVRANNPNLGTMDQIITALGRSLQRGGPRLQQYGIALDTAAIQQRAFEQTGKETVEQLTNAELSVAGLSLAMEQLNPTAESLAGGLDNVAIKADRAREKFGDSLETIGAPLVEPVTDAILALATAFEDVAGFMAQVSGAIGSRLSSALSGIQRIAGPLADALDAIGEHLTFLGDGSEDAAGGVDVLSVAVKGLARNAVASIPIIGPLINAFGDLNDALDGTADEADNAEQAIRNTGVAEAEAARITSEFWVSVERGRNARAEQAQWWGIMYDSVNRVAETARTNIPTIADAFRSLSEDSTAEQLTANLQAQIDATNRWVDDMAATQSAGYSNLTALLAEVGPVQSGLLLDQYAGRLEDLEGHLEEMAQAQQRANAKVNETALRGYLELRGITGNEANAIVATFAANLQLGIPAQEEIDKVIAAPGTKQLAAIAAWGGEGFAGAVNKSVQDVINEEQGKYIADNLDRGLGDGLSKEQAQAVLRAAIYAQRVKDTINEILGVKSPSTEMMETGRMLSVGLAMGITSSTGLVDNAMGDLGRSVLGVSLSAGAPSVRDVSVTVPVTVSGGMSAEDGRAVGEAAGRAAGAELMRMMRLEARVS